MSIVPVLDSKASTGYLYVLRHGKYLDTDIYKIGRTCDIHTRMKGYPKGSFYMIHAYIQNYIIQELHLKYSLMRNPSVTQRIDIGHEYFQGDIEVIYNTFFDFARRYFAISINYIPESITARIDPGSTSITPVERVSVSVQTDSISEIESVSTNETEHTNSDMLGMIDINVNNHSNNNNNNNNQTNKHIVYNKILDRERDFKNFVKTKVFNKLCNKK